MKRDITSESLLDSIMPSLIFIILSVLVFAIAGICFLCGIGEDYILIFVIVCSCVIVVCLPFLIYYSVMYRRFQKLLKTCKVNYGNLDEVDNVSIFLGGPHVVIDGHKSLGIYQYRLVKRLVNTEVEYILDGETAYLLRPVEY